MQTDRDDLALIITALHTTDTSVINQRVQFLCYFFRSNEYSRIVTKKSTKMMDGIPSGLLISYHATDDGFVASIQLQQSSHRFAHWNTFSSILLA